MRKIAILAGIGAFALAASMAWAGSPVTINNQANTQTAVVDASGLHVVCDSGCTGASAVQAYGPTTVGSATAFPPIPIGGSADGTATGAVSIWKVANGIGFINCSNCTGSGVSSADQATFTAGTSLFAGVGGFYQTTATSNPLTNGQQGFAQLTINRAFHTNLRNASGVEVGVAATPLQVSLANTGTNATAVKVDGSAVTQPVSGTFWQATQPVSGTVSITSNSAVNMAQVNGVTTLTGTGAVGTGTQRVAIGTDTATIAGSAPSITLNTVDSATSATGSAVPAKAGYVGANSGGNLVGLIQADTSVAISVSTATTTQLVALSSGKKIYVTGWDIVVAGADNVTLEYGTGSNCGTGTTTLTGAYNFAANGGISKGGGLGPVLVVPASNALCMVTSAAVQASGSVSYTQF